MVTEGLQHWKGRGPACNLANNSLDMKLLKKSVQTIAETKRDRGLLLRGSVKMQKSSRQPGPGDYNTIDPTSIEGKMKL